MTFAREVATTLRTISSRAVGLDRRARAAEIVQLIEDHEFTITDEFREVIDQAQAIFHNLKEASTQPEQDLAETAADPKKLKTYLDDKVRAGALDRQTIARVYEVLQFKLKGAAIRNADSAMVEFIERYKDSDLFNDEGGTPGERMLAQEKREAINETHRELLRAIEGWAPDSLKFIGFWFRWTYTPEQWDRIEELCAGQGKANVDELALSVGATHRFARNWDQANNEYDACLAALDAIDAEEKRARREGWTPTLQKGKNVYIDS